VSTSHAILDIVTTAFENIEKNLYIGLIFLDLQKAFDAASHDILLAKLEHYGIRGPANLLLENYIWSRPGFNSWPLLFLLYINDLPN